MIPVDTREDGLTILILGLVGFAMIFPLCVWRHAPAIESDLLTRCAQALEEQPSMVVDVTVNGRDVTLTGLAPDTGTKELVIDRIENVWGVRVVRDQISVRDSNSPESGS